MKKTLLAFGLIAAATPAFAQNVEKPAALVADGIPPVPSELAAKTRPYLEARAAGLFGWNAADRSMLIGTRFGNTLQLHRVATPLGMREQLSFEAEPIADARWAPRRGDVLVVQKDVGGGEFYQLYTLKDGRLSLLTDGKSRNTLSTWSEDGEMIAYSSTRRNGADTDLYLMNPRDAKSDRMVAQVTGGGWAIIAFAPDKKSAIAANYVSVTDVDLYRIDLATGAMTAIGDTTRQVAYGAAEFARDGTLWTLSDDGSDFQRLGTLDLATGRFSAKGPAVSWDVDSFDIADDGRFIAYTTNEAGIYKLRLLDPANGTARTVSDLGVGVMGPVSVAPWGDVGVTFTSNRAGTDSYSVDPQTLRARRWTKSETGGLDISANIEPSLVEVKSFDGLKVSGFLFKPDAAKFPGKRPLIMNVHGGPEGQSFPTFLGRNNYLLNELGIAIFYPNVRGSTGYGKRFVSLDNGPFKREDSVKDMGVFLTALARDKDLDASRFGLTGGSYGGYMCYAAAVQFAAKLRSTNCVVAISNFVTFLENTQSYRRDLRRVEYGDERDPKQRAKLLEISPLRRVDEMTKPMMVVTGGNDPRVPASEADQLVNALRQKGRTAWHLLGTNEGHGFAKKENIDYNFWSSLMFWQETLLKP